MLIAVIRKEVTSVRAWTDTVELETYVKVLSSVKTINNCYTATI